MVNALRTESVTKLVVGVEGGPTLSAIRIGNSVDFIASENGADIRVSLNNNNVFSALLESLFDLDFDLSDDTAPTTNGHIPSEPLLIASEPKPVAIKQPANAKKELKGNLFTPEEDEKLIQMYVAGKKDKEIAAALNRKVGSIHGRRYMSKIAARIKELRKTKGSTSQAGVGTRTGQTSRAWTNEEITILAQGKFEMLTDSTIGKRLGRTPKAVSERSKKDDVKQFIAELSAKAAANSDQMVA